MIHISLAVLGFFAGVFVLYQSSDALVKGTSNTAAYLGVSPLIISLLIVAFGTSAPEFSVSVGAAVQGEAEISLGNIIGSCVANLLLVVGFSAFIKPITISRGIIRREMPILSAATLTLILFSFFGLFDEHHLIGGLSFLFFFFLFVFYFYRCAKKERVTPTLFDADETKKNIFFIIAGIIGVIFGAWLLIESSKSIAIFMGIPTFVIAISLVAVGTSLPELVVSTVAAYRKESDISIGNVLGSNVFNIFFILGVSAVFSPLDAKLSLPSLLFLTLITLLMFPIIYTGYKISRGEGLFLLGAYTVFIWYVYNTSVFSM